MKGRAQHPMRWVRGYAIVAVLLAALIAGWGISASILSSPELLIRDVEIQGLKYLSEQDVLKRADLDQPKSTLKVQSDKVVALLQNDPWIRSVQLQRPRREVLRIVIQEATPRVIVATPTLMLADERGEVIDHVVPMYEDLPLLIGATRKQSPAEDEVHALLDQRTLALSRGMGGAAIESDLDEALDVEVVRYAVNVLDLWEQHGLHRQWPIQELGWDAAEGFTPWIGDDVELKLGHRDFEERVERARAALEDDPEVLKNLVRVDVRPNARAILRFSVTSSSANPEGSDD